MNTAQRTFSLLLLGAMTLALAPATSAASLGLGMRGNAHFGLGGADLDAETRTEIHAELKACRSQNSDDQEAAKTCAQSVAEKYDFVLVDHKPGHRKMKKVGHKFRSAITEKCGERENTDEWRTCAKEARASVRGTFKTNIRNRISSLKETVQSFWTRVRSELRTCAEIDTVIEMRACIISVIDINDQN